MILGSNLLWSSETSSSNALKLKLQWAGFRLHKAELSYSAGLILFKEDQSSLQCMQPKKLEMSLWYLTSYLVYHIVNSFGELMKNILQFCSLLFLLQNKFANSKWMSWWWQNAVKKKVVKKQQDTMNSEIWSLYNFGFIVGQPPEMYSNKWHLGFSAVNIWAMPESNISRFLN